LEQALGKTGQKPGFSSKSREFNNMKRKIVCNFWLPKDLMEYPGSDFEIIAPAEEISGAFSYADLLPLLKNADGFLVDTLPLDKTR
jgi:hypothetical protein